MKDIIEAIKKDGANKAFSDYKEQIYELFLKVQVLEIVENGRCYVISNSL